MTQRENYLKQLQDHAKLSQEDSVIFLNIADKMEISEKSIKHIDNELKESIPFEGGMLFSEVLTYLKILTREHA